MTDRSHIPHRLTYSCNCGWIDWGHANPSGERGATALWRQIWNERSPDARLRQLRLDHEGHPAYAIHFRQSAVIERLGVTLTPGFGAVYAIRRGLGLEAKKRVTLAILISLSHGFEGFQRAAFSASGYATDDLISNLIGYYRAVNGYTEDYVRTRCDVVPTDTSFAMYDAGYYEGRTSTRFDRPQLFPCADCPSPQFPPELRSIVPAVSGTDFVKMSMIAGPDHAFFSLGRPVSTTRHGQVIIR